VKLDNFVVVDRFS
jgi:hypothetical protein